MHINEVFQLIDREVWIITSATSDGRRGGLVATWVSQASIDAQRPVVVAGIAPNHFTAELIDSSGGFVAHLIAASQIELAWQFGLQSGSDADKFAGVETSSTASGLPIIKNSLAWLECRVIANYDAGDRRFYWADVIAGSRDGNDQPLRERTLLAAANSEQKAALSASVKRDVAALRAAADQWRSNLPPFKK